MESKRWWEGIEGSEHVLMGNRCTHVMDRESDSYQLYDRLIKQGYYFVSRCFRERNVQQEQSCGEQTDAELLNTMAHIPCHEQRTIELSARFDNPSGCKKRSKMARTIHPSRKARTAKVSVGWQEVTVKRSGYLPASSGCAETLSLWAVVVRENDPAPNEPAVCVLDDAYQRTRTMH